MKKNLGPPRLDIPVMISDHEADLLIAARRKQQREEAIDKKPDNFAAKLANIRISIRGIR